MPLNQNSSIPPVKGRPSGNSVPASGANNQQAAGPSPAAGYPVYPNGAGGYMPSPAPPGYAYPAAQGTRPPARPPQFGAQAAQYPSDTTGETQPSTTGGSEGKTAKRKKTSHDYFVSLMIKLGVSAAALIILFTVFIGVYVCHNNSSFPMVKDGDLCMTSRLAELKQGDLIVYKDSGTVKYGRVIAFEGDSVEIMNDFIAVNGYGLYDSAVYTTTPEGASIQFPYTVPDNCVFVLNDYRSDISDSRTLGGVSLKDVKGKVVLVMRRRGI